MGAQLSLSTEIKYRLLLELSQKISRTLDLQEFLDELLKTLRTMIAYDAAGAASARLRGVVEATRAFSGRDDYDDDFTMVVLRRAASAAGC